jgi:hypothetical protein
MSLLYRDKLVELTDDALVLQQYYFPSGKSKRIPLAQIARVVVKPNTVMTGKYRMWGTGDFRIWFPFDGAREGRDVVFYLRLNSQFIQPAFTVEDSARFSELLVYKGLLKSKG